MPDPREVYAEFPFPLAGIDVSTGYDTPPPWTTQAGVNVRSFDPLTLRARGGSRPGLVKYADQLPNGAHLIQTLGTIVTSDPNALLDSADATDDGSGGGTVDDPSSGSRNPGRTLRRGGTGRQPNRHAGNKKGIRFVRSATKSFANNGDLSVIFDAGPVTKDNLIVFFLITEAAAVASLTNSMGINFQFLGGFEWAVVPVDGNLSFTMTGISFCPDFVIAMLEYSGTDSLAPNDNESSSSAVSGTWSAGVCPVGSSGELVVAAFNPGSPAPDGQIFSTNAPAKQRVSLSTPNTGSVPSTFFFLWIADQIGVNVDTEITGIGSSDFAYQGSSASFKKL